MNVQELKDRKVKLEKDILNLINDFRKETKEELDSVKVDIETTCTTIAEYIVHESVSIKVNASVKI